MTDTFCHLSPLPQGTIDTIDEERFSLIEEEIQTAGTRAHSVDLGFNEGLDSHRPNTVSGRVPSQTSKARLSRTPAAGLYEDNYSSSGDDLDDDDDSTGSGFLITELRADGTTESHFRRGRRHHRDKETTLQKEPEFEEDYDTDLELDEEWLEEFLGKQKKKKKGENAHSQISKPAPPPPTTPPPQQPQGDEEETNPDQVKEEVEVQEEIKEEDGSGDEHDPTGRKNYLKLCEKLNVVPVSYFTRHISEPEIVMRYHGLGPQGTRAIARVLREVISLERLNLAGNWMEGEGGMYIAKMLTENEYISELSLADNRLGSLGSYHLSKMLQINGGLRKLDLGANEISDKDAPYLAQAIEHNKFLKELILDHNNLGEVAGEILGPAIGANDILEHIDLSWNQLRRKGAVAVARGIKENVRLKKCNLAWNGFGPEGGIAIADAIGANDALRDLDISGNRLDGHSGFLIAKGLRKNEELTTLRIGNNPISTSGAIAIATALNENESSVIEVLDLTDIPVEFEFIRIIEEIRKRHDVELLHGPVLRSGNTPEDIGKPAVEPYPKNPLIILREHIVVNDFRILDILQKYDEYRTHKVTVEQFASALEEMGIYYTKAQLDEIAEKLDLNSDGKIFYGEILKEVEDHREAVALAAQEEKENQLLGMAHVLEQAQAASAANQDDKNVGDNKENQTEEKSAQSTDNTLTSEQS